MSAGIGACSHNELAVHVAQNAAVFAGRVDCPTRRQCCPTWSTCIGPAVAGLDELAAFRADLRVRHVENLLIEILNLLCGTSAAVPERSSQSRRRKSWAAAALLLAEWRARALAVAAAAAGAAGGGAGCTAVVVTCSSCPSVVSPTPHMHAQHAHARVHVHAQVHVHMHAFTIENKLEEALI